MVIEVRGELFSGFRLLRLPDVILPQLIRPRLRTAVAGPQSLSFLQNRFDECVCRARLLTHGHKIADGTVGHFPNLKARGRGRLGRSWHSEPESGLYFSMILRPKVPPSLAPLFTFAAANCHATTRWSFKPDWTSTSSGQTIF